jgi:hypothetical protein
MQRRATQPWWHGEAGVLNTNQLKKGMLDTVNLGQKIVQTQIAWEKHEKCIFGHILPLWVQFRSSFPLKKSRSWASQFVNFGCPVLYNKTSRTSFASFPTQCHPKSSLVWQMCTRYFLSDYYYQYDTSLFYTWAAHVWINFETILLWDSDIVLLRLNQC